MLQGVNSFKGAQPVALLTFKNHCLDGKLTFGDPFLDSGVVGLHVQYMRFLPFEAMRENLY